jgi:glutamyl-Q tRNA(Asp) synthetase
MTGGEGAHQAVTTYQGRFAPSPTGPLHAGSLVAALASWLDARAWNKGRGGRWLVRIEDVDTPRCVPGAAEVILQQLATCGLMPDAPPVGQSTRSALYQKALEHLIAQGNVYPCACSRKDIEDAHAAQGHGRARHAALPYPGTCRHGLRGRPARSWRFNTTDFEAKHIAGNMAHTTHVRSELVEGPVHRERFERPELVQGPLRSSVLASTGSARTDGVGRRLRDLCNQANNHAEPVNKSQEAIFSIANGTVHWTDRRLGPQAQDVASTVGDFVLRRADGLWAYQLAVVVDDADQQITHVVRGEDLADNTPRQILLQQALGLDTPSYLHTPLVCGANGEKLSKQNGATALDLRDPLQALGEAARVLGLPPVDRSHHNSLAQALGMWVNAWARIYNRAP